MYVSRAVRSIREDPIEGVALALTTADDADPDAIAITTADATDEDVEFDG
jgi:hypothetical protein